MTVRTIPTRPEAGDNIELQARSVLHLLLSPTGLDDTFPISTAEDPATCPNCGCPCDAQRTPYCSACCKNIAAFVRQFRTVLKEGKLEEPERQVGLGQKLWSLLGGGLPLRLHLVPASAIRQVMKRTNFTCELCGAPATTVDHTGSG